MNDSSTSGAITSAFENISTVFTAHSEITSGGFNCLYKAQRYGKWYVLKGLKPEFRNSAVHQELLAKEFELGIKMNHPHIAQTVGLDTDPLAGPCIVMEYVDGVTLKEFLQTNPSAKTRLKIAHELLSAMAYFHGLQIVHRDLKPDNILITRNGHNVKLIDFGLADSDYHGVLKQPAGSDRYAAPEQKEGKVAIDCRADIYAFGKILRQLFPHRYGAICRKCVQPDRNKRYNNAEEIGKRLRKRLLTPSLFLATLASVIVCLTILFLTKEVFQTDGFAIQPTPSTQAIDTVSVIRDSIITIHDTVVIASFPKTDKAKLLINQKLKALYKPFWEYYKQVSADSTIPRYKLWFESFEAIPENNPERNKAIIDEVVKRYPEYTSKRWDLEQYLQNINDEERNKALRARMDLFPEQ